MTGFISRDPATGTAVREYPLCSDTELDRILAATTAAGQGWREASCAERAGCFLRAAEILRRDIGQHAAIITGEMGKPIREARAEVEKCALACAFFARHAEEFLRDEPVATDAVRSIVSYRPLGTVLAIMPWNFPYWQVFRFAAPALMAGNCALIKPAPNVPGTAAALEDIFTEAGFPPGVFRWLCISHDQAERAIADPRIHAVTLTGSTRAGRRIAALAGAALKKTVLELGGSDPFIVLDDADLETTVAAAIAARFQNSGQSCIAAKRFILAEPIAAEFLARFRREVEALTVGDPRREETRIGPLARADLRDHLHRLVADSIALGAVPVCGCKPLEGPGFFYAPSILDGVRPGMPAYDEELFGPVAAIATVRDDEAALALANRHRLGMGGSVWTRDIARGERLARRLECGALFVNAVVKSDPRLPFGGIKDSGYGRELGPHGVREFTNIQTLWIA